jgi:acyl phosphate:glycerol-3-phosphate acyltransferase
MVFILIFLAYILGSIPTGVVLTKVFGNVDPRTQGSKNIGATNVFRTAGKKLGIFTLLGDILKGLIPVVIAQNFLESHFWIGAVALVAFVGHLYPIFLKFKGGKGVATGLGVFLALSPISTFLALLVFAAVVYLWRYISLGSLIATAFLVVDFAWRTPHKIYIPFAFIVAALIFYRHRENMERLLTGKENKFGVKKGPIPE